MAKDIGMISDPDLRNAVWNFEQIVEARRKKEERRRALRGSASDPNRHYIGHSEEQVAAAKRLADRIQGVHDD